MRGNSFANGNSHANGNSMGNGTNSNGPYDAPASQGWLIRVASIWDHLEPGLPA